jgi:tRNA(Ile)-lysidine synthase
LYKKFGKMYIMKSILAISGGVDSVLLLDEFAVAGGDFVVAHFDHGMRPESAADAAFVWSLAARYNAEFVLGQGNLGVAAGETMARARRYEFLWQVVKDYGAAELVTAHHADDLIETVMMNLLRGTGWRGLAPMAGQVTRSCLTRSKAEIVATALQRGLTWREDSSNFSPKFFRNRVRVVVQSLTPAQRRELLSLIQKQTGLRAEIENIVGQVVRADGQEITLKRYELIMWPLAVAREVLRAATNGQLTTPQLDQVLLFAKTARPGKKLEFKNVQVRADKRQVFITIWA